MSRVPRSPLLALAGSFLLALAPSAALASSSSLSLQCTPTRAGATYFTNTCQLAGYGFHPHERIQITYTVSSGGSKTVYRRRGVTDGRGTFVRPPFVFTVDPRKIGFGLNVVVKGTYGDYATTGVAAAP